MAELSFDPSGLEITPAEDRFAAFIAGLETMNMANLTDRLGATYGDRSAFILESALDLPPCASNVVSFADIAALAARASAALTALGVALGDRVALCTRNR